MDKWLGRSTPAKPALATTKKPTTKTTALPIDCQDYTLPEELTNMLALQTPSVLKRMAWPITRRLGFGSSCMERADPTQWIRDCCVRVVVDLTHGELRDKKRYVSAVEAGNAVLVHLPLDSKHKMQTKSIQGYLSACRTLHHILSAARQGADEPPFAIYVCDSRGGGVAALLVEMLVALEFRCSLPDACVYVTRTWNANLPESAPPQRMFPEGDVLKDVITALHSRLREQPIVGSSSSSSSQVHADVFATHRVPHTGRGALCLLELDASVLLSRPPFTRTTPMQVVVWLRKNDPLPPKPEPHKKEWTRRKRQWTRDDDDSSSSDDDYTDHRQRDRRYRRHYDSDSD